MARMFEPGDELSPSGCVCMDFAGRRGEIVKRPQRMHCTWCGGHVTAPRRRTWCSQECVDAYQETQPNHYRWKTLVRANNTCEACGQTNCALEVDHTIPIIEGGHPFDPENLRALRLECHKGETAALAKRRADARRVARGEGEQVGLFGDASAVLPPKPISRADEHDDWPAIEEDSAVVWELRFPYRAMNDDEPFCPFDGVNKVWVRPVDRKKIGVAGVDREERRLFFDRPPYGHARRVLASDVPEHAARAMPLWESPWESS